jgi:anti-sigma-K factor RskA
MGKRPLATQPRPEVATRCRRYVGSCLLIRRTQLEAAWLAPADWRWLIMVVVAIAQLMVVLDSTVVNIALPSAQRALGFPDNDRQ